MTRFVLVPGAGGAAWYWHPVVALLRDAGHEVVALDLPAADPHAGLAEYTALTLEAIGDREDVVLAAASFGGFTAPMVAARHGVAALVLVNAMVPLPGERPGKRWDATGSEPARLAAAEAGGYPAEFELDTYFLHDVDPAVLATGPAEQPEESDAAFESPCAIEAWPEVPTRVLVGADDRFFPAAFQRRVAQERLGLPADVIPGGHLLALANPSGVADYLLASTA